MEDQPEVVKLLLKHQCDVDVKNNEGHTPLFLAADNNCHASFELLLDHATDIDCVAPDGRTLLHLVADKPAMVKRLLSRGAAITTAKDGTTPLHKACRSGVYASAELLVRHGADVNAIDSRKDAAIHHAVLAKSEQILELLIKNGVQIELLGRLGRPPLSLAAASRGCTMAQLLIDAGASYTTALLKEIIEKEPEELELKNLGVALQHRLTPDLLVALLFKGAVETTPLIKSLGEQSFEKFFKALQEKLYTEESVLAALKDLRFFQE